MWLRRVLAVVVACLICATSASAQAQDKQAQDKQEGASADTLFERGMTQMKKGNFAEACQLLEKSLAVDYGMAAQFRLAECYEKMGRSASAWRTYTAVVTAAQKANKPRRAKVASKRAADLETKLTKIAVAVTDAAKGLNGLVIQLDGKPLPSDKWGQAQPVDPGSYEVTASAPGYRNWSAKVTASKAGELQTIHVPMLQKEPSTKPLPPPKIIKPTSKRWLVGVVVGGAGLVTMGVGGLLGLVAKGSYDAAEGCTNNGCGRTGLGARASARNTGLIGSVLVGIGGAATATGLVLWLTAPSASEPSAGLRLLPTHGGAQLSLGGQF